MILWRLFSFSGPHPCRQARRKLGSLFLSIISYSDFKYLKLVGHYLKVSYDPMFVTFNNRKILQIIRASTLMICLVALGGLVASCLPLETRFAGSNPAEADGFLKEIKIHTTTSFGGK
jgi:hypothetical protein